MSDILRDFDKKNEFPKVTLEPSGIDFAIFDFIADDIRERKDNTIAMEFTRCIGELLRKNGVVPKITEYTRDFEKENTFETKFGVSIDELDFSEHDKPFEDKIASLEKELLRVNGELERQKFIKEMADCERQELKQRIAELESKETETCEKEPISDDYRPSMEWYDNRHQSDCIEINRLNTTIDVLIHKVEYLRQFAGLE